MKVIAIALHYFHALKKVSAQVFSNNHRPGYFQKAFFVLMLMDG